MSELNARTARNPNHDGFGGEGKSGNRKPVYENRRRIRAISPR